MKQAAVLFAILLPSLTFAGSISGSIGVYLTISEAGKTSSSLSNSPSEYEKYESMSLLTNVADGKAVDIFLNGKKVASTVSQNGTINVEINWKDSKAVNLEFKSEDKHVEIMQTAFINASTIAPKMSQQTYRQQVPMQNADGSVSMKNVESRAIDIEY